MLLSGRNEIKLADLGVSKLMKNTHASTFAGTQLYMSPEVFKALFMSMSYYPNTDVWYEIVYLREFVNQMDNFRIICRSLGCVLFELKFLTFAFPKGQFGDPPIPSNVSSSGLFSSILEKYLNFLMLLKYL